MVLPPAASRTHSIQLKNDRRSAVLLSHFGYFARGRLLINITSINVPNNSTDIQVGLTLDRSTTSSITALVEGMSGQCIMDEERLNQRHLAAIGMVIDVYNRTMTIWRTSEVLDGILIYDASSFSEPSTTENKQPTIVSISGLVPDTLNKSIIWWVEPVIGHINASIVASNIVQSIVNRTLTERVQQAVLRAVKWRSRKEIQRNDLNVFADMSVLINVLSNNNDQLMENVLKLRNKLRSPAVIRRRREAGVPMFQLFVEFPSVIEEGAYDLHWHRCGGKDVVGVSVKMDVVEKNWNSFLSAGDQPLPLLFFIMSSVYVILTVVWVITLRTSELMVFKIHYLMLVLLVVKALSLFFHGINYFELGRRGIEETSWAVMYYITHLLKGSLLFITIILIGAGWAFIKHWLSPKEKRIFIVIIPLQILANVAAIIIGESEESAVRYLTWRNVFILVDLVCCGAILFPVIWSIKHLKEAAGTDGKQQQAVERLRLFRHFYVLIICYIYFTRIVVYLLVITVSFRLLWTVDLFREVSTAAFMIITGYRFRPASNNPYLQVPDEDPDGPTDLEQKEHAWAQSGVTDGVTRVTHTVDTEIDSDEDEDGEMVHFDKSVESKENGGIVHTSRL